jgi:hypothetical protein
MTKRSEVLAGTFGAEVLAGTFGAEVLAGTLGDAERGRMVIAMPGRRYFHQRDLARSGQAWWSAGRFGQHAFARYTVRQRAVIRTLIRSDQGVRIPPV